MSAVLKDNRISVEDYLAGELISEIKHEYEDGYVYAMSGASKRHDKIVINLLAKLSSHLSDMPCAVYSNVKAHVSKTKFYYPDVMVMCDERKGDDVYTEKPVLIVEVLSKSTHRRDKTVKRAAYQSLPSLQEYVLIEQDVVEVIVFRRAENWFPQSYFLGEIVHFKSVDFHLSVEEIYLRVDNEDMQEFLQAVEKQP